jgi:hypothetical protein
MSPLRGFYHVFYVHVFERKAYFERLPQELGHITG